MTRSFKNLASTFAALALLIPHSVLAQEEYASADMAQAPDFGDDDGDWAQDGECDDPRFTGEGMTETTLLDTDIMHDATDCRTAFEQGRLRLKATSAQDDSRIIWGDDESERANNGQCDDMRFEGFGMSEDELLTSDVKHDASDCRDAYINGGISLLS